ncbi:MAG: signal peptidase II [Aquaspirillum sp.]|jgi:signal peptidase II
MSELPSVATPRQPLRWFGVAGVLLLLDQVTKLWFDSQLQYGEVREVIPHVWNWTLLYNPGAAFSFLADAGGWQRHFFTLLALAVAAVLSWMLVKGKQSRLMDASCALILSGAISNLIDRVLYGHVIDFIQWYWQDFYWPAFNIADSAITVGAVLMVLDGFRSGKNKE